MSSPDRDDLHARVSARLSEHLDDELDAASRAEVEAHLRACGDCRVLLAELRAVVAAAHALPDGPPPRELWPAIAAAMTQAPPRDDVPAPQAVHAPAAVNTARARTGATAASAPLALAPVRRGLALPLPAAAALLLAAVGLTWWLAHPAPELPTMPRYLLLLHETPSDGTPPPPEVLRPIIARYAAWRRDHAVLGEKLADDAGQLLRGSAVEPLRPAGDAIGGLFIIEAADDAQARAIAATCPHLEYGGSIELRRIEDT